MLNKHSIFASRFQKHAIAFACAALIPLSAQALTLPVNNDATVTTAKPNQKNGLAQKLPVDAKQSAVLGFSYTSIPAGVTSNQVAKATLRLWVNVKKGLPDDTLEFHTFPPAPTTVELQVTSSIAETFSSLGSTIATQKLSNFSSGNWLELDVTDVVKSYIDNPSSAASVIYIKMAPGLSKTTPPSVNFDSKENTQTGHPAWIDLELTGEGAGYVSASPTATTIQGIYNIAPANASPPYGYPLPFPVVIDSAGQLGASSTLNVGSNQWNPDGEGDFRIGNATYRLKMGIALEGSGKGDAFIRAQGGTNHLKIIAEGGTTVYSNAGRTTGVSLSAGGGAWNTLSDRNSKENLQPVDGEEVLLKLESVPISTWNYKSQGANIRHIGPMAQDFYAAFSMGEDNKHISTIDTDGVALAAIKALNQKLNEKDQQIEELQHQLDEIKAALDIR